MPVATVVVFLVVFLVAFVPLALTDRRSPLVLALLGLTAVGVVLGLGLVYGSLTSDHDSRLSVTSVLVPPEFAAAGRTVRVEAAPRWAVRALGAWVILLAAGELLRVVLKRPAGTELVGPSVVLLGGLMLFDTSWAAALGFALAVVAVAVLAAWRPTPNPAPPPAGPDAIPGR